MQASPYRALQFTRISEAARLETPAARNVYRLLTIVSLYFRQKTALARMELQITAMEVSEMVLPLEVLPLVHILTVLVGGAIGSLIRSSQ